MSGFPSVSNGFADLPLLPATGAGILSLDAFEDFIGGVVDWNETDVEQTPWQSDYSSESDYIIAKSRAAKALTPLSHNTAPARHAANLIAGIVGAFPEMMLRRRTFPPFIHPHWHLDVLPETLASCVSIAQLFVTRTEDTRPFLWRAVDAELQRFTKQIDELDAMELQHAVQAATIYIIMAIIDQNEETPARGARVMQIILELKLQMQRLIGESWIASRTEVHTPSSTWEDWIFAESRRRIACFWFVIIRVFALKTEKAHCPTMDDYLSLPLQSSKTLWEARTRDEWHVEQDMNELNYPIWTFGELLEAQALRKDGGYAKKLNNWEVGVDKLGTMMSIAMELVV